MKFTTLIPLRLNDGRKVPLRQLRQFMDELAIEFGGCSDEGVTKGQWIDPKNSVHYRDESRRVSVVCDRVLLDEARRAVIRIGRALGQRAMYSEVRDYDGRADPGGSCDRGRGNRMRRIAMAKSKAQAALEFVREEAKRSPSDTDLHNAFFGNGGKLSQFFPTREQREAFANTPEYEEIMRIRASLAQRKKRSLA